MGGARVYIADSVAGTDEGICILRERCTDGVIGFDAEFLAHTGHDHKLIALLQLAVTPSPRPHCSSPPKPHPSTPPSTTRPTPTMAAASQSCPTPTSHTTGLNPPLQENTGCLSKGRPTLQTHADSRVPLVNNNKCKSASREKPFVLLVQIAKMRFHIPYSLLRLLQDPGLAFVTVNFKAGDGPSLQRTLQTHFTDLELLGMDGLMQQQFDLDTMTRMGVEKWGTAIFGAHWAKPNYTGGSSWGVRVQVCANLMV